MRLENLLDGSAWRAVESSDPWSVDAQVESRMGPGTTEHDRNVAFFEAVTGGEFVVSYHMMRARKHPGYHKMDAFVAIALECYHERLGKPWCQSHSPWRDRAAVASYMGDVIDRCKERGVWYHPGWLKCLARIRGNQPGTYFR